MTLNIRLHAALAALAFSAVCAMAQTNSGAQSSSSIVRRAEASDRRANQQQTAPGVTGRMEQFYAGDSEDNDANLQWMRVIYRHIDLEKDKNAVLYYPEDASEGQENLFRILLNLLASNTIPAYEYLDGREVFNDTYRIKVKDILDRFHILYTDAKGSSEKNPKFTIDPSDVPTNEVLSYYVIERWEFDNRENRMVTRVEAICPVLHRTGDFGGEAVKYPMFWVKLQDIRPWLAQQPVFISDDNNLPTCTLDDFFTMNLYEGDIYKTRNLRNRSMAQMYPDPDDLKRAQDSIHTRLTTFEDKLWVPSREELAARREALEAIEAGADSTAVGAPEATTASDRNRRVSRSSRKPATKSKQPKVKEAKAPKVSSSSAAKSVRRRKR